MKHIIFAPLKEEYVDISIRASELNSYMNPSPYEFTDSDSRAECMREGDIIHNIAQYSMLMWKDKWVQCASDMLEQINNMWDYVRTKEYERLKWAIHEYADLVEWKTCDYIEQKRQVIIEYSWYKVTFSWTSDAELGSNIIIDLKSAWSKRKQEKADSERQKYYYAWLKNVARGTEDTIEFRYYILTKQKKPQFQEFIYHIDFKTAERYVKNDLKALLTARALEKR